MGRTLIDAVLADGELSLAVALDVPGSPALGKELGGVKVGSDLRALATADVLIDFTRPEGTLGHLEACVTHCQADRYRDHRILGNSEEIHPGSEPANPGGDVAQFRRRRERAVQAGADRRRGARQGLRRRDHRGAPSPQGGCALRYRPEARGNRRQGSAP